VPQTAGIYDDLTAEENLAFTRAAFGTGSVSLPEALRVPAGVAARRLGAGHAAQAGVRRGVLPRAGLAGLPAEVGEAPASIEERFVELTVAADVNR